MCSCASPSSRSSCSTERSVREWLRNQAAGGYITYDPESDRYTLPDEHALALADEESPFYLLGVYDSIASLYADEDRILDAFRTGGGMGWHEHDHRLFRGTERFFRPGYKANLVAEWIPALDGVQEKLERGAKVADIGCGHGASTIIMAEAFPKSEFFGFDYHDASIERAREAATAAVVCVVLRCADSSSRGFLCSSSASVVLYRRWPYLGDARVLSSPAR